MSLSLINLKNLRTLNGLLKSKPITQNFTVKFLTSQIKMKKAPSRTVNFDMLGTWDSRVELPLELESSISYGRPIPKISVAAIGAHSMQGKRSYNEDRFVIKELKSNLLYFAVFDGHGGSECAEYCYHHMEDHLMFWIDRCEKDFLHVIDSAFLELNNSFGRWWVRNGCATSNVPGSTATVGLLHNNIDLYLGHVGDSRALLCRNGKARRLTSDHCPLLLAEKNRVEQSQGEIFIDSSGRGLVNGRLAMTRSLGDLELKPFGVTAVPDVRKMKLRHGRDAFLVLTTDGINCVMSDQEICDVVQQTEEPSEAAQCLTDHALHYSSGDNATAIVVPLGSWGNNTSSASIFYSFGRSMTDSSRFS